MRKITITLSSEKYPPEDYKYNTEGEALAGLIRLYKSCQAYYRKDKIKRKLTIEIGGAK